MPEANGIPILLPVRLDGVIIDLAQDKETRSPSEELRIFKSRVAVLAHYPINLRMAKILLELASRYGDTIRLTQENLASIVGTSREIVTAHMGELYRKKAVSKKPGGGNPRTYTLRVDVLERLESEWSEKP